MATAIVAGQCGEEAKCAHEGQQMGMQITARKGVA